MPRIALALICLLLSFPLHGKDYLARDFGILPNRNDDQTRAVADALAAIKDKGGANRLLFERGTYHFYPQEVNQRTYFISNHDQDNPKQVGIVIEDVAHLTIQGDRSEFLFHGRMLPIAIVRSRHITLRGITIDFPQPHIAQVTILANDTLRDRITYRVAPWVDYEIRDSLFVNRGAGWENVMDCAIGFEGGTRHILYRSADIDHGKRRIDRLNDSTLVVHAHNPQLSEGSVLALRNWYRPTPGILVDNSRKIALEQVTVHYAEGMGLLAQLSEKLTLDGFRVCLRGDDDPRYFTTQADATHFSGCKGKIVSRNGFYEGMMDDAINVHGIYLRILRQLDEHTLVGSYIHPQAWGFAWGHAGDRVQFIRSATLEKVGKSNKIVSISAHDQPGMEGAREMVIRFRHPLPAEIGDRAAMGIENLTRTPKVRFEGNTIRNNRARGALFTTPRRVLVQDNLFDHTSGTAILLCGDCDGWFESGACRDVVIRRNVFRNALTSLYQFTNAIITIEPEIPDIGAQRRYFHHRIRIYDNTFITFDKPIVFAKSVDGLAFYRNRIEQSDDYAPFHFNTVPFYFERVAHDKIHNNTFSYPFDPDTDILRKP